MQQLTCIVLYVCKVLLRQYIASPACDDIVSYIGMKVCHFSDTHGNLFTLDRPDDVDVFVCSGDFFPNSEYFTDEAQTRYQRDWFRNHKSKDTFGYTPREYMREFFAGKPVLWVPGNHDWIDLSEEMPRDNIYLVDEYNPKTILGKKFAGFRHIPYIAGYWKGEIQENDFEPIIKRTFDSNPDILVTHTPPANILSGRYGSQALLSAMMYRDHNIKLHLFGHIHEFGGKSSYNNGVRYCNSATTCVTIEI